MLAKMVMPRMLRFRNCIVIHFRNGRPVKLINKDNGIVKEDSYELFVYLNEIAGKNGIGL